jgi:uncharacterized membrane protein
MLASVAFEMVDVVWTPTRFLGRLHPLLVHVPIAFVFGAAAVEAWRMIRKDVGPSAATRGLLIAAAVVAVPAAVAGWLNAAWEHASVQGSEAVLLDRHRWLGTIATLLLVAIAVLAWRARRAGSFDSILVATRLGTFATALLVAAVGHLGGEVTHGEGYVLKGLSQTVRRPPPPTEEPVVRTAMWTEKERYYMEVVRPILVARCEECHGEQKAKGSLRLIPAAAAFNGPEHTWSILPGQSEASELIARVLLPRDDPEAMPPDGDPLTAEEIAALERWINEGAASPKDEPRTGEES